MVVEKQVESSKINSILSEVVFESLGQSKLCYAFVMDEAQDLTHWTPNTVRDFEGIEEYMYGAKEAWMKLIHPCDRETLDIDSEHFDDMIHETVEFRVKRRNGEYIWIKSDFGFYKDENGASYITGIYYNIGDISPVDSVTQLHNIYELDRVVEQHLMLKNETGTLLYVGIDNFKTVNDQFTYGGGNEVLRALAIELGRILPPNTSLYRLDGDKFAVFYPEGTKEKTWELFRKIRKAASCLEITGYDKIELEVTGGAAVYPRDGRTHGDFLRNVEYSLEKAKKDKRGTVLFFSRRMLEETLYGIHLTEELTRSVKNGFEGFEINFQPIVDSKTKRIMECETLLRWNHPQYPEITPTDFIPLLESTGMIVEVGKWILDTALEKAGEWNRKYEGLIVNINVSYIQMEEDDFADYVMECVKKHDFPPSQLVLELTESCRVKDMYKLRQAMENLRSHNMNIALDDFGTGYASLSVLRDVPVDWVKIDHNFVKKCKNDKVDRNIVRHIIMLAHSIGVKVCVEGVENDDIHDVATEEAADTLQGYLFGRPVQAECFEEMLRQQG